MITPSLVEDILFFATVLLYLKASALFLVFLFGRGPAARAEKVAPRVIAVAVMLHAAHIISSSVTLRTFPIGGVHFGLSVISMLACALYLAIRQRYKIDVVGAFVAPLALTFLLASRFVGLDTEDSTSRIKSMILPVHITVNLLGEALFTLAFAAAVTYLLHEKRLKQKRVEGISRRLPPLDVLDKAEHRFLLAGFPLLTIGILTGTLWARKVEAGSFSDIARAVFGYITWLLFAGVLFLRAVAGWRGRRAAYGTIAGFGFALLVLLLYLYRASFAAHSVLAFSP